MWSSLVLVATLKGIGSAYFAMLFVLGPLIIRDRTLQIFKARNIRSKYKEGIIRDMTLKIFKARNIRSKYWDIK